MARFLIDTSALARIRRPAVSDRLLPLLSSGVVGTCAVLDAEAQYSARDVAEYERLRSDRRHVFEYVSTDDECWVLALEAQRELARSGRHRAVGIVDLLICAVAATHQLAVLHYDADFETAAEVIDVDQRWVVERGSVA